MEQRRGDGCLAAAAPLAMSCWRTRGALSVLVSKEDCAIMLDRLELLEGKQAPTVKPDGEDGDAAADDGAGAHVEEEVQDVDVKQAGVNEEPEEA